MTRQEQNDFVANHIRKVQIEFHKLLFSGKIPENWNDIELRAWLADKFVNETKTLKGKRLNQYIDDLVTNNLIPED